MGDDYRQDLEQAAREVIIAKGLHYDVETLSGLSDLKLYGILHEHAACESGLSLAPSYASAWDLPFPDQVRVLKEAAEGDSEEDLA